MMFGTNGWPLRNYGICLLVALRYGLSGYGSAACAGSLSLQEPTISPADQRRFIIALLVLILCSVLIIKTLNPQQ
jgi:hypothetical protein